MVFPAAQRQNLLEQLAQELAGSATEHGPVIFEIPLEQSDKMDVLVVWEAWQDVPSETRSDIILEVYKDKKDKIFQALGVTYHEAIDQHLLPYAVIPMTRREDVDGATLKTAMLKQGGFTLQGGKSRSSLPHPGDGSGGSPQAL